MQLDYRKYADPLFEILIVGGLLAPGGSYIEDGAPLSPFSIFAAKTASIEDVRPYVDTIEKMVRRYKFLQKPLEESTLPRILQYTNRFDEEQAKKLAVATALAIQIGLTNASVLAPLQKDHLTKDEVSLKFMTEFFRTYLKEQTMENLASALRKGGIRDWLLFFPQTKRSQPDVIPTYFRNEAQLPQVAEYYGRRQLKELREKTAEDLAELVRTEGTTQEEMLAMLQERFKKLGQSAEEFIPVVWEGLARGIDADTKQDQMEQIFPKEIERLAGVLEPWASNARAEITLINLIQVHCYTDTRVFKTFPHLLKVLYNENVVSDGAIVYWAQKGAKPQGKQHFLKLAEPLVEFLQNQDSDEEEDEE
ncbi:hypothetical protein ACI68E_000558 [Malassezia pachydermatis]